MARSKSKLHAATLGGSPDEVEAAFYESLQTGNVDRLMSTWADEDDIVCIHPGGPRLRGVGAIRANFEAMFAEGATLKASIAHVHRVDSLACAVHHVLEKIELMTSQGPAHGYVLATNVYHKTAQGWRMVVHHASPGSADAGQEITDAPKVLH